MEEIDIVGFDGQYTITKEGDVFSYKYNKKRKLNPQKASQSKKGYYQVRLFTGEGDTLGKLYYVHRLMWETFRGDIPEGKQIDHINADTSNNSIDNLQCITARENMNKWTTKKYGLSQRLRRDEFIELYKELGSYERVGEKLGITWNIVYRVIKDVVHYKDSKTGKFKTRRYNPSINDEFTRGDRRKSNGTYKRKRDDKGRFM